MLKDRKFDQAAVDDLLHLKQVMALENDDVAEALRERCVRIEKKFGNLMLSPEGKTVSQVFSFAACVGVAVSSAGSHQYGICNVVLSLRSVMA